MEVEEQEIDSRGNILSRTPSKTRQIASGSEDKATSALIRDSSRNRLQRLGALYSDTENLSSPIHRNESRFDDEQLNMETIPMPKARFAKLTQLAQSINNWEDEASSSDNKEPQVQNHTNGTTKSNEPKIVGVCPRKFESPKKTNNDINQDKAKTSDAVKGKQLQWDKSVMNALERQGFKRRDTNTSRLVYDYNDDDKSDKRTVEQKVPVKTTAATTSVAKAAFLNKPAQNTAEPNKKFEVSKGIVSGRAAIFENSSQVQGARTRQQKDPAEMSLKERMALFEKNKGTALIPKAALGMAPSAKQIMSDQKLPEHNKASPSKFTTPSTSVNATPSTSVNVTPSAPVNTSSASKINAFNKPVKTDSHASGAGIRQTVAALLSNTTTISESQIASQVRKARDEEMNVLLNRFNNKQQPSAPLRTPSPPPAPPMPSNLFGAKPHDSAKSNKSNHKRRSGKK